MKKLFLILIIISVCSEMLLGQEDVKRSDSVSMVTNRPGFTEASRAVLKGGFQIETGFHYSRTPDYSNKTEYTEQVLVPNLGVLLGVSNNVELRVFGNLLGERDKFAYDSTYKYSFADLSIGTKINLFKAKGWVPEVALLLNQGIPTTPNSGDVQIWRSSALLAWSYSLPANFGVSGNLGYTKNSMSEDPFIYVRTNYFFYTLNVGYTIAENQKNGFNESIGAYIELYGVNSDYQDKFLTYNLAGGFYYRMNPKFQIDIIGGYSFENESILVNGGFSWLIKKG